MQTVRLLDYSGMCRCQMWTARCLSAGLQCSGLCHGRAHYDRTWILLDTVRMLWVNLPCGKWRRISSHSPRVPSFQSHQACTQQSNTARPPAWKHTAASDCHPVHVAAAPFHWLLSCTPPKHSHVEHFYSFSIFTLGFSWMGMQLGASPPSYS